MFDFDAGKLLIIGIVALVFIPSKDLPRVLRQLGQFVSKMRRMASEFQGQFMEAMREADMAELRKEAEKLAEATKVNLAFNPIEDLSTRVNAVIEAKPGLDATDAAAMGAASAAAETVGERSIAPPELSTHATVGGDLVEAAGAAQMTEHGHDAERLTPLETATEADRAEAMQSVSRSA